MLNDKINNIYGITSLCLYIISFLVFLIFLYIFYKENDENANIYDFIYFNFITYWKMLFKKQEKNSINKKIAKYSYIFSIFMFIILFYFLFLNNK